MKHAIALLLLFALSAVAWAQSATACAEQAAKMVPVRTSHYDPATNTCYVMLYEMNRFGENSFSKSISVVDAFEGRTYAHFFEAPTAGRPNFATCTIFPPHKAQPGAWDRYWGPRANFVFHFADCHSETEFRERAFKLYGIAQ